MRITNSTKVELHKDGKSYWKGTFAKYAKRIMKVDEIITDLETSGEHKIDDTITLKLSNDH